MPDSEIRTNLTTSRSCRSSVHFSRICNSYCKTVFGTSIILPEWPGSLTPADWRIVNTLSLNQGTSTFSSNTLACTLPAQHAMQTKRKKNLSTLNGWFLSSDVKRPKSGLCPSIPNFQIYEVHQSLDKLITFDTKVFLVCKHVNSLSILQKQTFASFWNPVSLACMRPKRLRISDFIA